MSTKVHKFIRVGLFKEQAEIIEKIQSEKGEMISGVIRQLLTEYGDKYFPKEPAYVQVQKERLEFKKETAQDIINFKKLSPEDYATQTLKSRISKGMAWLATVSTQPYPITLAKVKEWKLEDTLVQNHLKIINNEEVYALGAYYPMSDKDRAQAIKNWENA